MKPVYFAAQLFDIFVREAFISACKVREIYSRVLQLWETWSWLQTDCAEREVSLWYLNLTSARETVSIRFVFIIIVLNIPYSTNTFGLQLAKLFKVQWQTLSHCHFFAEVRRHFLFNRRFCTVTRKPNNMTADFLRTWVIPLWMQSVKRLTDWLSYWTNLVHFVRQGFRVWEHSY